MARLAPRMLTGTMTIQNKDYSLVKFIRLFLVLSCISILLLTSLTSGISTALSAKQRKYINNGAGFYNIDECSSVNNPNATSASGPVFILGDSIMYGGFYGGGGLDKAFKEKKIDTIVDAQGSRAIKQYPGKASASSPINKIPTTGIKAVDLMEPKIKDAGQIIIELGTNQESEGSAKEFKDNMTELVLKMKGINPNAQYYAVNFFSTGMKNRAEHNSALEQISKSEKTKLIVIDTVAKVTSLDGEKIHPSYPEGYKQYNPIIVEAVSTDREKAKSGQAVAGTGGNYEYISVGKIPKEGIKVGASIYGGRHDGKDWLIENKAQKNLISSGKKKASDFNAKVGPGNDDVGIGNRDNPLSGTTSYAELSTGGGGDFSNLGDLPNGTKLEITYKGKSIIAEKGDVGGGGGNVKGEPRAIDLWWEALRLLDPTGKTPLADGVDVVSLKAVAKDTPVTPVSGAAGASSEDTQNSGSCECSVDSGGSSSLRGGDNEEQVWNYFIDKKLSPIQVAGIMGNMSQESGFVPTRSQGGGETKDPSVFGTGVGVGKAWGLIQWDAGGRAIEYAKQAKITSPIYELKTQLDIVWWHMNNVSPTSRQNMLKDYKPSNEKEAARIYEKLMEGAGTPVMANREAAASAALRKYSNSTQASPTSSPSSSSSTCGGDDSGSQAVSSEGYALPVKKEGVNLPCKSKTCHHDGTPAADLGITPAWEGTPVYAIVDGKIDNLHYRRGLKGPPAPQECKSFQLVGKDGWVYWYGHIRGVTVKNGQTVKAGQKIAVIGQSACADTTPPHLHIDRGAPKGKPGGSECCRDGDFIALLNKIYEDTR